MFEIVKNAKRFITRILRTQPLYDAVRGVGGEGVMMMITGWSVERSEPLDISEGIILRDFFGFKESRVEKNLCQVINICWKRKEEI